MGRSVSQREVDIQIGLRTLKGFLVMPDGAVGLILFAHGSGSGRRSPRNQYVARQLQAAGMGTLLFDLLTEDEETADEFTGDLRFDIELLAGRLMDAADWCKQEFGRDLRMGYFGASTGAGAALTAAARRPENIYAVVSRGGRPDLAEGLERVRAPTLLIVGGRDEVVIDLNQHAFEKLVNAEKKLQIVPGATHLFEEPGTLDEVARLAAGWFHDHLAAVAHNK